MDKHNFNSLKSESSFERMEKQDKKLVGIICAIIAAILWGLGTPFGKIASENYDSIALASIVSLVGSLSLFLISSVTYKQLPRIRLKSIWLYVGMGILGFAIPLAMTLLAYRLTLAINVSFLLRVQVFLVLLYGMIFFHEKINLRQLFGLVLGFLGVFLFVTNLHLEVNLGDLVVLGSTIFWASYLIFSKKLLKEGIDPITLGSIRFGIASIPLILISLIFNLYSPFSFHQVIALLIYTFAIFVIGTTLYNVAIKHLEIWKASAIAEFLSIISSGISVWLVLGEVLTLLKIVGGILIITGVLLAIKP